MSKTSKKAARYAANALPVYRVYAGYRTAEHLRTDMKDPRKRTWAFGRRVLFDALTDTADGVLARYAGKTVLGGYLDQIADKAWFLQIGNQLAKNGELRPELIGVPAARDAILLGIRPIAHHFNLNPDSKVSGKLKMHIQVGAAVTGCSPIAHAYPEFTQDLFALAAGASVASGLETFNGYINEIGERYQKDPSAALVIAAAAQIYPIIAEAA